MTASPAARAAGAVLGGLLLVVLAASPAVADPPRPTDYRSTVTSVDPALPEGAEVRIVGGDSLIELSLPEGHTAVVSDYASADAEPVPYLRFDEDGTVRRNALAVATTANESRYGSSDRVPDPSAAPEWETVATDGTYAWHDHRIHWMSPKAPRVVDADGQVDLGGEDGSWTVPITVDGTATVVTGTLVLEDPPFLVGWIALVAAIGGATLAIGLWKGQTVVLGIAVVASLLAVQTAYATWSGVPPDAGASSLPLVIAVVALVASTVGVVTSRVGPPVVRRAAAAATAAALLGWGVVRWTVLARAVLPTTLAPALDRFSTAAAIGVGLAVAALIVLRPSGQPSPRKAPITANPTA